MPPPATLGAIAGVPPLPSLSLMCQRASPDQPSHRARASPDARACLIRKRFAPLTNAGPHEYSPPPARARLLHCRPQVHADPTCGRAPRPGGMQVRVQCMPPRGMQVRMRGQAACRCACSSAGPARWAGEASPPLLIRNTEAVGSGSLTATAEPAAVRGNKDCRICARMPRSALSRSIPARPE